MKTKKPIARITFYNLTKLNKRQLLKLSDWLFWKSVEIEDYNDRRKKRENFAAEYSTFL